MQKVVLSKAVLTRVAMVTPVKAAPAGAAMTIRRAERVTAGSRVAAKVATPLAAKAELVALTRADRTQTPGPSVSIRMIACSRQ
jgi:hypothetical protein